MTTSSPTSKVAVPSMASDADEGESVESHCSRPSDHEARRVRCVTEVPPMATESSGTPVLGVAYRLVCQ